LTAQALPVHADMRRDARETEPRHIVLRKAAPQDLRRVGIGGHARRQAIEVQDCLVVGAVDREEGFRAAEVMALTCVALQKIV